MKFTVSGGQSAAGPAQWFTGNVFIDGIRNPDEQSAVGCAHVRFTPGARTAWHGATSNRFMSHVAIQEADASGQVVTWLEHVTDEEYARR
jgi:hypothetical protein